MATKQHVWKTGDLALDRDGRVVKIVRICREDGVDFAWVMYPNHDRPDTGGEITSGVWEHSAYDRRVMGPDSNYWDDSTWIDEPGLREVPTR